MKTRKNWKKILLILFLAILLGWIYLLGKIFYHSQIDTIEKADSIVVLGASQWSGEPSPVFKARLDHARDLYKEGYAGEIVLTGGVGEGEKISEAMAGKNYLTERGVGGSYIFMEEKGRTSWQSLKTVAGILKEQNLNSIIIVSDGFHMMRLGKMAEGLGIKSYSAPVKIGPVNNNWRAAIKYYIRESVVYVLYLLFKV